MKNEDLYADRVMNEALNVSPDAKVHFIVACGLRSLDNLSRDFSILRRRLPTIRRQESIDAVNLALDLMSCVGRFRFGDRWKEEE